MNKILNDTRLQDFVHRVAEYGKQESKGLNAKPQYALDVVQMAHEGVIGDEHAENIWKAFSEASNKVKGDEKLRLSTNKTDKVRISETRKLIACGAVTWPKDVTIETPMDMLRRAVDVINTCADARGSTYQNLVLVAREQLKKRAAPFTDDEIKDAITPDAPEIKAEKETLEALVKRMRKIHDGDEKDPSVPAYPSGELLAAIKAIETRLANLANVEEVNKMFATAASMGFTIASAPVPAAA